MQNLYNLISREEEREMNPYCVDAGIAGIPWSSLAMGALTGKNRETVRTGTRFNMSGMLPKDLQESNNLTVDRVEEIAKKHNATNAQIAMAWLYTKKYVTSPIVGISKIEHLYDVMGAFDVELTEEEVKYLEEPYTPRNNIPF
jgi:aryl-alcohol dehydrogenase-like predicted oxidoreductase